MNLEERSDCSVLAIKGPIRLGEAAALRDFALRASQRQLPVDLDLSEAEHLHAAAWQVIFALRQGCIERGVAFQIKAMSPAAATASALLGLEKLMITDLNMPDTQVVP